MFGSQQLFVGKGNRLVSVQNLSEEELKELQSNMNEVESDYPSIVRPLYFTSKGYLEDYYSASDTTIFDDTIEEETEEDITD